MHAIDSIAGWIKDLVKTAKVFDDKGKHHPEHPGAAIFDSDSATAEKGHTSADFSTKKEFDKREVGNPSVESKYPDHSNETDIILDENAKEVKAPPKATHKPGETTAVSAPMKYDDPLILEKIDDKTQLSSGHIYELPKSKKKSKEVGTPHGSAAHEHTFIPGKVKAFGNFLLLKNGNNFALMEYKNGLDKEGTIHATGLLEDEANALYSEKIAPYEEAYTDKMSTDLGMTKEEVKAFADKNPENFLRIAVDMNEKEWWCLTCGKGVDNEQEHWQQGHKLDLVNKEATVKQADVSTEVVPIPAPTPRKLNVGTVHSMSVVEESPLGYLMFCKECGRNHFMPKDQEGIEDLVPAPGHVDRPMLPAPIAASKKKAYFEDWNKFSLFYKTPQEEEKARKITFELQKKLDEVADVINTAAPLGFGITDTEATESVNKYLSEKTLKAEPTPEKPNVIAL